MPARTSMLHVRVDETLKSQAAAALASAGLTVSEAVRILLARVVRDGALPAGLAADGPAFDAWFRANVKKALAGDGAAARRAALGKGRLSVRAKRRAEH